MSNTIHARLLDCTLRDGAYLIDKTFGDETIKGIIQGLINAKVDLIEIGFLQDEGQGEGKTVFLNSKDAEKYIPQKQNGTLYTVLADYSRYSIENLDAYTGKSFNAVRECFLKKERQEALEVCKKIKDKGYLLFIQPVDILGYTDTELIEYIQEINKIEPYCFSIVDTFGSMYLEDLQRIFSLLDHNLVSTCKIGFHSHNNLQMSSALCQEFFRLSFGKRQVVVDSTISGMGRGAGNTPTELVMQYMVDKLGCLYDIDAILDIIDNYMENIKTRCSWGYSTSYFIAGCYGAHVNNIAYLKQKNSIRSKDIRYILNKIGNEKRKRYDYDLLENTYLEYVKSEIDDSKSMAELSKVISKQRVLIIAPGSTVYEHFKLIKEYISNFSPIVIAINFIPENIDIDYLYLSNARRYDFWSKQEKFNLVKKILTSNLKKNSDTDNIVSFLRLVKCGFSHVDNSALMLLRLLDQLHAGEIAIAGLDGYDLSSTNSNYVNSNVEIANTYEEPIQLNFEISEMLKDYIKTRQNNIPLLFVTPTRFSDIIENVQ